MTNFNFSTFSEKVSSGIVATNIQKALENKLGELPYTVSVSIDTTSKDYRINVESTPFNTTPLIFESISVNTWSSRLIRPDSKINGKTFENELLSISLSYRFKYFANFGENGVNFAKVYINDEGVVEHFETIIKS